MLIAKSNEVHLYYKFATKGCSKIQLKSLCFLGSSLDWSHITNQIGMFCFTGLNKDQVCFLINKYDDLYVIACTWHNELNALRRCSFDNDNVAFI